MQVHHPLLVRRGTDGEVEISSTTTIKVLNIIAKHHRSLRPLFVARTRRC